MDLTEIMNAMPFARHVGIDVTAAADGRATGELSLEAHHSSVPGRTIAHGGVAYALADTVAGAAVISLHEKPTPTIDMRIDYLAPAQTALTATAEVVRDGANVATATATIRDREETRIATAHGVYKTGGGDGETAWGTGPVGSRFDDAQRE
ncbi:PaaI family thioesterase [Haloferacaceae archaeon DSL9]